MDDDDAPDLSTPEWKRIFAIASIKKAIEIRNTFLQEIGGCGDGGCIIIRPVGQHTNGGCRCNKDSWKMLRLARINRIFAEEIQDILGEI